MSLFQQKSFLCLTLLAAGIFLCGCPHVSDDDESEPVTASETAETDSSETEGENTPEKSDTEPGSGTGTESAGNDSGGNGKQKVTLTFDYDGGMAGETLQGTVTGISGTTVAADEPLKDGFAFAGWVPELPSVFPDTDTAYKAQWRKGPQPVENLMAEYDFILKKITLCCTCDHNFVKQIRIVWKNGDAPEEEISMDTGIYDNRMWSHENIEPEEQNISFRVYAVDKEGCMSSARNAVVQALPRYRIGQILYADDAHKVYSLDKSYEPVGIIFEVSADGTGYKMVSCVNVGKHPTYLETFKWQDSGVQPKFPSSCTDGMKMLEFLRDYCKDKARAKKKTPEDFFKENFPAAFVCSMYDKKDSGWYLPAAEEMLSIYKNLSVIKVRNAWIHSASECNLISLHCNAFACNWNNVYWTAAVAGVTSKDIGNPVCIDMTTGGIFPAAKDSRFGLRAVYSTMPLAGK